MRRRNRSFIFPDAVNMDTYVAGVLAAMALIGREDRERELSREGTVTRSPLRLGRTLLDSRS